MLRFFRATCKITLFAASLLCGGYTANAATYYVSQSTGDDSLDGLAAAKAGAKGPWKTLAKASIEYNAGDSILLKKGDTWNEELTPKGSGTPEKPILISSYGQGNKPLIDREDFKQDRTGIRLDNKGGYKIVGIEFARCMTGIYAEYAKGAPTQKYLWIEDCYFRDSLLYGRYEDYPKRKIGLGVCLFSWETDKKIVMQDIMVKNCVFRRLASGFWTNSPDNFNKNASFVYNFANLNFENCLFEEGYQWQLGIRGVIKGSVKNCVTHDVGRGFRSFNGVAGAMFFRCKDWIFEDSEWGFVDIGLGSGDGEAFDFEGNCDNMIMRNCNFHDTDGPGFLLCCYASDGHPNMGIVMENCVINAKSKRPIQPRVRAAIINTTDWTEAKWNICRFYLSKGESIMAVMDREKDKRSNFKDCFVKNLSAACISPKHPAKMTELAAAASATGPTFLLDFGLPVSINEFKLKEDPASGISRYIIETWDDKKSQWKSCFNGRGIGGEFVCAIVPQTTSKARLRVIANSKEKAVLTAFDAHNDPLGDPLNVARGGDTPNRPGK
jgi:hypothetical protein